MELVSALIIAAAIVFVGYKVCGRIERGNWILGSFDSKCDTLFRVLLEEKGKNIVWLDPTDPLNKHTLKRPVDGEDAKVGDTVRLFVPLKVRRGDKKVDLYAPRNTDNG